MMMAPGSHQLGRVSIPGAVGLSLAGFSTTLQGNTLIGAHDPGVMMAPAGRGAACALVHWCIIWRGAACPLALFLCLAGAAYRLGYLPPSVSLCVDRGVMMAPAGRIIWRVLVLFHSPAG